MRWCYQHEGEEFVHVVEGRVKFWGKEKCQAGPDLHFNSGIPHNLKNHTKNSPRCLWLCIRCDEGSANYIESRDEKDRMKISEPFCRGVFM
jgi:uncharacterized cupin superfamily protein